MSSDHLLNFHFHWISTHCWGLQLDKLLMQYIQNIYFFFKFIYWWIYWYLLWMFVSCTLQAPCQKLFLRQRIGEVWRSSGGGVTTCVNAWLDGSGSGGFLKGHYSCRHPGTIFFITPKIPVVFFFFLLVRYFVIWKCIFNPSSPVLR